jgi:hypothetical protein
MGIVIGFFICYFVLNTVIWTMLMVNDIKNFKSYKEFIKKLKLKHFLKISFLMLFFGIIWGLKFISEEI